MYVMIVNENAGSAKTRKTLNILQSELSEQGVSFLLFKSDTVEATATFLKSHLHNSGIRGVIIVGGDGTTNSVIQMIANTQVPIAIFPTGSGNDTARMFQLTKSPTRFVQGLLNQETVTLDLLKVNDRYGMTIAGVGIDSAIGDKVNRSILKPMLNKLKLGSLHYILAAVSSLITFQPFHAKLFIDGEAHHLSKSWLIACGNTTSYGGGLTICPQANPYDGKMNLTILHNAWRPYIIFRLFPLLFRGKPILKRGVTYTTAKKVVIKTARPIQSVVDGEVFTTTPVTIDMQKAALKLILTK